MLKSYEALLDHGQIRWLESPPEQDMARLIITVLPSAHPDQAVTPAHPAQQVDQLLSRTAGAWGKRPANEVRELLAKQRLTDWGRRLRMAYLFDSNVFIFQLNGVLGATGQALLRTGLLEGGAYSVISRIEVLGYPQSSAELALAEELFEGLNPIDVDDAVIAQTIRLRQMRKIKIPDAIIAASALIQGLPLVTNNLSTFNGSRG